MLSIKSGQGIKRLLYLLLVFFVLIPAVMIVAQGSPQVTAQGSIPSAQQAVSIIAVDGEITPAMAAFLKNAIENTNSKGASGIIIEIQTLGGRVDSAIQMRDAIFASKAPVAVYIESRAISAGALISIAAKTILMAPGSHMGSAQPIPNDPKTLAFVSGEFRTTAEKTGRDPKIALAMVDESVEIPGLVGKGEILDLTANEAFQYGYADYIVSGRNEALKALGWENAAITEEAPDFRFWIAQFLTSYEVASLLLTLGILALIVEFYTPGFGVPGIIGITFLVLYFSSGFIAGYTELWAVLVFIAGIILLLIEMVVPGFGVFGISGIIAMFVGIIFTAPSIKQGVLTLLIALVAVIAAIPILIKIFGKSRFMQRLVLTHSETAARGYVQSPDKSQLIGQAGVAITVLRPSGKILVDGTRIDAITDGAYIDSGAKVKIIQVEGSKVIVSADQD